MHASRDRFARERPLPPQARRDSKLGRIALAPREQISLFPTEPAQLLGDDPSGLGFHRFPAQLSRVMLSEFALHLLQELCFETLAPQAPAAARRMRVKLKKRFDAPLP
jgi:hypothetical protein